MTTTEVERSVKRKRRGCSHRIQHRIGPTKRTLFKRTAIAMPQESPKSNASLELGACACLSASKVESNINNMPGPCIHKPCEDVDQTSLPKAKAALSQNAVTSRQFNAQQM